MNTIAHIAAAVALLWLSTHAFDTLSNPALGFAALALFFFMLAMTINAVSDDWVDVRARFFNNERGRSRR